MQNKSVHDGFIERLNKMIAIRHISVQKLAEKINFPVGTLKHILRGRPSYKSMEIFDKLAQEFGVSI